MSFVSRSQSISSTATGILQLCAGMLIIPILDVFAKLLGGRLDPVEVTLMRFIMQACLMAPFVIYLRLWQIPPNTLLIQARARRPACHCYGLLFCCLAASTYG